MLAADLGGADGRRLLRAFRQLGAADRASLLAFAEFLVSRAGAGEIAPAPPLATPVPEPRPTEETVVSAIKRLRRVYPMLDGAAMLTETSGLMAAHVLQGRGAAEVIDDLEALFARRYAGLLDGSHAAPGHIPE